MYSLEVQNKIKKLKARRLLVFEDVKKMHLSISTICNRNCTFCGKSQSISNQGFMDMETFINCLKDLNPNELSKIDITGNGEPFLNKNIYDMIDYARCKYPKVNIDVISNSDFFRSTGFENILKAFDKGLTSLTLDFYDRDVLNWFKNEYVKNKTCLENRQINIVNLYSDLNPWSNLSSSKKYLFFAIESLGFNKSKRKFRAFDNFAGNMSYEKWENTINKNILDFPMVKSCTETFKYLTVNFDGTVNLCCRDSANSLKIGNVNTQTPNEIWQCENMQVIRFLLKNKCRKLLPSCSLCNYHSFRDGLYGYYYKEFSIQEIEDKIVSMSNINKKEPIYENLKMLQKEFLTSKIVDKCIKKEELNNVN
jgi:radical SAM protein with 4Fe4S-binding SPASM domain